MPLMTEQQETALAQAVTSALAERNLSVNAASIRLRIDRQALTRFSQGIPPSLEVVERFARGMGLDVNEYRKLSGYPPVDPPADVGILAKAIISTHEAQAASLELEYEPDLENVRIVGYEGRVTPEDRELALKVLRAVLAESRRKQDT